MKKLREPKRGSMGDKAVAVGGFLIVLLTGFFGAEPAGAPQVDAAAPMMMTKNMNDAKRVEVR